MTQTIAQALINHWNGNVPTHKEAYLELIKEGIWEVEFTKVSGEQTIMHVTLDPTIVPPPPPADPAKLFKEARAPQDHLIHAFSTDRGGWRSFVVANVTGIRKIQ